MDQNDIDFRDQRIKIVQRKILQLNHQILCWPVLLMGCQAIKQICPINSQTYFTLTQEERSL